MLAGVSMIATATTGCRKRQYSSVSSSGDSSEGLSKIPRWQVQVSTFEVEERHGKTIQYANLALL